MPRRLLRGPAAWRGEELAASDAWIHSWTTAELVELEHALSHARAERRPIAQLRRGDFPLSRVAERLATLHGDLLRGRGFALLRGLDVAKYTREDVATIFWGIGQYLGRAVPQNAQGHLLGHVMDVGRDARDPNARIYQTNERQGYHTDSADIVGLLCLEPAPEGGTSSLVSCATLHNELFEACPELLVELFRPFCTDHRGEHRRNAKPYFTAPVLSWFADELSVLYQRRYIESAQRFDDVPRLSDAQLAALDAFDLAADDPRLHLEMTLERGDMQFIHNHQLLHDRTAFRDAPELGKRRHLLRLWLCPEDGRALPDCFAERLGSVRPGLRGGVACDGVEQVVVFEP